LIDYIVCLIACKWPGKLRDRAVKNKTSDFKGVAGCLETREVKY